MLAVGGQGLTEHPLVSLVQTHVKHTAAHESFWVHFIMTLLKHIIGFGGEGSAEGFSLIKLTLVVITSWTVFIACVPAWTALILLSGLPAFAPFDDRGHRFAGWILKLIAAVAIEVAAQTTNKVVVRAWEPDHEFPVPVISDSEAEVCLDFDFMPLLN